MNFEFAITLIGPLVLIVNIVTMLLCFRPKYGKAYTITAFAICAAAIQFLYNPLVMHTPFAPYGGVIIIPIMLLLFRGQTFQKLFAFFMGGQFSSMNVSLANVLVSSVTSTERPIGQIAFFLASLLLLSVYMTLVLRFGKRFFERLFVDGHPADWALYSLGAAFSFFMSSALQWQAVGALLYVALITFIIFSFCVLCYTIIKTHEKAAGEHHAETIGMQMSSMREQTDDEKKHRDDLEILRHDMRHEMSVIMELYHNGNAAEAEAVYADWQTALSEAVPPLLCAEPMLNAVLTRFERRAMGLNIHMNVNSNIPGEIPADIMKLSVMMANALENALSDVDEVQSDDKRIIQVKLLRSGEQISFEVNNYCAHPIEFDDNGLPISRDIRHDRGVRSILTYAEANGYLLKFSFNDNKITLRLVMDVDEVVAAGKSD